MSGLPRRVQSALKYCNWTPVPLGKQADEWMKQLESEFTCFPIAEKILRQYGGLHVDSDGVGQNMARSGIRLDPLELEGESDIFGLYEDVVSGNLYPIGRSDEGRLVIDESGYCYHLHDRGADRYENIEELIRGILLGIRGERVSHL